MRKALPRDVHKVPACQCLPARLPVPPCPSMRCPATARALTRVDAGERGAVQEDVHVGRPAGGKRVLEPPLPSSR